MGVSKGDVVRLRDRDGLWVFAGARPGDIPPLAMGKFINTLNQALTIGLASATLVVSPTFTPGDVVKFQGGTATVESDGESTVTLTHGPHHVPVPPRGYDGEHFTQTGRVDADRARLVIGNIDKFIID
jgi:hypothetical protein